MQFESDFFVVLGWYSKGFAILSITKMNSMLLNELLCHPLVHTSLIEQSKRDFFLRCLSLSVIMQ